MHITFKIEWISKEISDMPKSKIYIKAKMNNIFNLRGVDFHWFVLPNGVCEH